MVARSGCQRSSNPTPAQKRFDSRQVLAVWLSLRASDAPARENQPPHLPTNLGRELAPTVMLWFDGDGLCLFAKRLERGRFIWPQVTSGTVSLTSAQLSMLLEGIDWRHPVRTAPQIAV
jgi:IS66 Orf2 like protein